MKFVIDALHALILGKIAIIKLCHFNDDGVLMLSLAKKASLKKTETPCPPSAAASTTQATGGPLRLIPSARQQRAAPRAFMLNF
ncbi:hypothetical protein [Janthinobacterium sp. ZB1P44]|jgi:hypothetical protein|uniref:hypothetical protein n=1 Tax=Janthinobacterium sp. ZB1P44 TaxID=3424192 RepID=UPI003F255C75